MNISLSVRRMLCHSLLVSVAGAALMMTPISFAEAKVVCKIEPCQTPTRGKDLDKIGRAHV